MPGFGFNDAREPLPLKLHVSDLVVRAPDGRTLLGLDRLTLERGDFLCVAGPSGAGKSTLLFALAGLAERASGRVLWDDTDVLAAMPSARARLRRERIGFVFQDFLLFDELGARANAALGGAWLASGARRAVETRAAELLVRLGLDPDDPRPVEGFSGGERQRVAVARALATDPAVVLADEPTASLDRAAADALVATLVELVAGAGRTLIVVSHDPALRDAADRVVEFRDGAARGGGRENVGGGAREDLRGGPRKNVRGGCARRRTRRRTVNDAFDAWWFDLSAGAQDLLVLAAWLAPTALAFAALLARYRVVSPVRALLVRHRGIGAIAVALIALSVGLGVALLAQERGLREGSARAADPFDLLVAAPGSDVTAMLASVYLQSATVPLLDPVVYAELAARPEVALAAPLAFGDSVDGAPLVGTTAAFVAHLIASTSSSAPAPTSSADATVIAGAGGARDTDASSPAPDRPGRSGRGAAVRERLGGRRGSGDRARRR